MVGRVVWFGTIGGIVVGAAAGGLLTPIGLVCGTALGLVAGPVTGLITALGVRVVGPVGARTVLLGTPTALIGTTGLLLVRVSVLFGGVTLVAIPLLLITAWLGAPWCLTGNPDAIGRAMLGVVVPAAFAALTFIAWAVLKIA